MYWKKSEESIINEEFTKFRNINRHLQNHIHK